MGFFVGEKKMSEKKRLVRGVGVNDSVTPVTMNSVVLGKKKQIWKCPIYTTWGNMLDRCYSEKVKKLHPTYQMCSLHSDWLVFSEFRGWAECQDWAGKELDKDILYPGNKIYSPDTCVFISKELNRFITDRAAYRGANPIGVSQQLGSNMFMAHCNNPHTGICEYLGSFRDPWSAHEAWRMRKNAYAMEYADLQEDERVAEALRKRYAFPYSDPGRI